jgi:hypothetical protein
MFSQLYFYDYSFHAVIRFAIIDKSGLLTPKNPLGYDGQPQAGIPIDLLLQNKDNRSHQT